MRETLNLIADLRSVPASGDVPTDIEIGLPSACDERTLAWIDAEFGGAWSSEAYAGLTIVARRAETPVGFATIQATGLRYAWLDGLARQPGVGLFGPFGVARQLRKTGLAAIVLARALSALRERGYTRALIPAVGDESLVRFYRESAGAQIAERFDRDALIRPHRRTVVMASGNGSNFQAVLDASRSGNLPLEIVALVSNNAGAYALQRARDAGVRAGVVAWNRNEEARESYDRRLYEAVARERPDAVLLLGWMHLLSESFVRTFREMFNLHPAFLPLDPARDDVVMPDGERIPAYRGARAVRDALRDCSRWVGATLHRVTPHTDRGPVMARKPLLVESGENQERLMQRVHDIERGVVRAGMTRWLYER